PQSGPCPSLSGMPRLHNSIRVVVGCWEPWRGEAGDDGVGEGRGLSAATVPRCELRYRSATVAVTDKFS
ncbi:hypothetical protein GWI33_011763, partial [Rhynchophorus ferrugineus]